MGGEEVIKGPSDETRERGALRAYGMPFADGAEELSSWGASCRLEGVTGAKCGPFEGAF